MKKTLFKWLSTAALVLCAHMAFAQATTPSTPYYSTKHPSAAAAASNSAPATDILIVNNISKDVKESISTVRLIVPNSPIDDLIYAKEFDHVKNQTWPYDTRIQLFSRAYGPAPFFDRYVSNHAVLTIMWKNDRYAVEVR